MKKMSLALIAPLILWPVLSFAQSMPQAPESWTSFQKEQSAKRAAFAQQMKAETDAFLNDHPEVKAYFEQMRAANKERFAQWKAAHQR